MTYRSLFKWLPTFALILLCGNADMGKASVEDGHSPDPPITVSGGAPSIDALMEAFLAALEKQDVAALNSLRLTKDEYQGIIVPGTVPPGSAPRRVSAIVDKHFWEMLDFKSDRYVEVLLQRYGGKKFNRGEVRFTKPAQHYDWYNAWGETRQVATDVEGTEHLVTSGWIAEVRGQYKFISFQWDD